MSLISSLLWPVEVFIFAYAFLGPLHYLTEINWLSQKKFFAKEKMIPWFLLMCSTLISADFLNHHFHFSNWAEVFSQKSHFQFIVLGLSFCGCFLLMTFKKKGIQFTSLLLLIFALYHNSIFMPDLSFGFILFLPTLIHVFLFTGLFLFSGSLKEKHFSGHLSLLVFISVPFLLWFIQAGTFILPVTDTGWRHYLSEGKGFAFVVEDMVGLLWPNKADLNVFQSYEAIFLMRFLAFSYLYHYLNWFSKVEIIKWNQMPKGKMGMILTLWLGSCALYLMDYASGLIWLFFLSYCHVLLEFPLNFKSLGLSKRS